MTDDEVRVALAELQIAVKPLLRCAETDGHLFITTTVLSDQWQYFKAVLDSLGITQ
jgi:hypothetical protein